MITFVSTISRNSARVAAACACGLIAWSVSRPDSGIASTQPPASSRFSALIKASARLNEDPVVTICRLKWEEYLGTLKAGDTLQAFQSAMKGRHRYSCKQTLGGSGTYLLVYVVDDFLQVVAQVKANDTLLTAPSVEQLSPFVSSPDGDGVIMYGRQRESKR